MRQIFECLYTNVRGLRVKLAEFRNIGLHLALETAVLTETWLLHKVMDEDVILQDMTLSGYDTVDITGCGMVISINSHFTQYRIVWGNRITLLLLQCQRYEALNQKNIPALHGF